MADSDDEYERRNVRDKFRHERSDYERRDEKRGRDSWEDRSNWSRNRDRRDGYRETDRGQRDRRSPVRREGSPPQVKRIRRDWGDDAQYPPHYDGPYGPPVHGAPPPFWVSGGGEAPPHGPKGPDGEVLTQPPMMTFKHYLSTQDDNITEDEALKRYSDYKTEFKKAQIVDFFVVHKEEEWFRSKYHPDEFDKHQEECTKALKNRCQAFMNVFQRNMFDKVSLDAEHSNDINRVLDAAVIFMEGGTEFDLKSLDEEDPSEESNVQIGTSPARPSASAPAPAAAAIVAKDAEQDVKGGPADVTKPDKTIENTEQKSCKEESIEIEGEKEAEASKTSADEPDADKCKADASQNSKSANAASGQKNKKERRYTSGSDSDSGSSSDSDNESAEPAAKESEEKKEVEKKKPADDATPKPRALHKTLSIFLRNLAPSITKQEVEALCKRYPGFLRVAIQDPQPERRFTRRGWVTFDRTVNVKDICWNLNNIRLRECDMGPIVNREIKQRIRPINGLAVHRQVAKLDIKHAAKIIQSLDTRWKMWHNPADEKKDEEKMSFGFVSNNPVLKNITDFLVDEGNYEEEALLGVVSGGKDKEGGSEITIERDEEILKVLDRLLFYLRIVYSIDYYSAVEYPNEDEMPHRCGMMHVRGTNSLSKITHVDVSEWMSSFEAKIAPFLNMKTALDDGEAIKLGKKSQDDEVEKFIVSNMQELAKDKWLCPLSGKKFKGPEFVRKHILTKHTEKIEEVKKEVVYFNNYLSDPRRPQLPEHPSSRQLLGPPPPPNMMPSFLGPPPPPSFYRPPVYPGRRWGRRGAPYAPQFYMRGPDPYRSDFRREIPNPRRDRGRPDPRAVINYNDLDAPADVD